MMTTPVYEIDVNTRVQIDMTVTVVFLKKFYYLDLQFVLIRCNGVWYAQIDSKGNVWWYDPQMDKSNHAYISSCDKGIKACNWSYIN